MTNEKLYEILGDIHGKHIQEAGECHKSRKAVRLKWGAAAACLCLVAAVAVMGSHGFRGIPTPPDSLKPKVQSHTNRSWGKGQTEAPYVPWVASFNAVTGVLDASRVYIPGYFTEELSADEIAAVVPARKIDGLDCSGRAGFDGSGNLIDVCLTITTTIPEVNLYVLISEHGGTRDYILDTQAPVISVCEDIEYSAYQWDLGDGRIILAADAEVNGCCCAFTLETLAGDLEQAKVDFSRILECFSDYANDQPDLSTIIPDRIPEWFDKTLSHQEALDDPTFGAYMLQVLPDGFVEESIRRYQDQTSDYLSGLWTRGCDELRWKVYSFSDADEGRLTGIAERENYDLSLYPIPRASSVPEVLREVVDNPIFSADELTMESVWARAYQTGETGDSSGWRMEFSVRYGDIIVEVCVKGVDPQWVYQQLMLLNTR